ncbi:branched-chain-amino-acid transaminase [Streptosporangium oxazolinicum]|uniref:Branched-chain-amino-acid transaminase n=1 Tax=Streptosporangium oxazolinicum TaxID=909287 RepID=A0ABP8ALI7_9ACTN
MGMASASVLTFWDGSVSERRIPFGGSSMQHGTAVFEGIRCYLTQDGPALFRLEEHLTRLLRSAALLGMAHDYGIERLEADVLAAAAASGLPRCYVRPALFTADPILSIDLSGTPFTLAVEVWPATSFRPPTAPPARLMISTWRRPSPATFPPGAKATGMYVVSALARTEAAKAGYDDAIQLDPESGRVAEASVANVFLVRGGRLITPWLTDSLLPGITRDTVLVIARKIGMPTVEEPVEVRDLLTADEVFLTGTASELVPVASIGDHDLPACRPVFDTLSRAFRQATTGLDFTGLGWLTPVRD